MQTGNQWYEIENVKEVFSPSLLVYPSRVESNIRKMVGMAGDVNRLRPHVKTHKMAEIVRLQMKHGISKFKCATISETEMVGRCGAKDILLALQPVGPNIERFFSLKKEFPESQISCIADSEQIIRQISDMAHSKGMETSIWIDINNGMNRTGIAPGEDAIRLYMMAEDLPMLKVEGLHVYDGHIHEKVFTSRQQVCNDSYGPVEKMIGELRKYGARQVRIVAGGSPTFSNSCSKERCRIKSRDNSLVGFWYSSSFSDMDFSYAAVLLARIVSKPAIDLICIDLGHKAVGAEMPQPRINIPGIDKYTIISQNEEHMVIRTPEAHNLNMGDPLYAIPWHICPTVDRFDTVNIVTGSKVTGQWNVEARRRRITF